MTSRRATTARRVLVAVDASPFGLAGLEMAVHLAGVWDAELLGLFVEDDRLMRLAGLPFAREIAFSTATSRPLGPSGMECMLRAKAERVRQTLAGSAGRAGVTWSLQVARGDLVPLTLAMTARGDVVVLARDCPASRPAPLPKRVRSLRKSAGVAVVWDGTKAAKRALATAVQLAAAYRDEVTAFVAAESGAAKRLARSARRQLDDSQLRARVTRLAAAEGAAQLTCWARQHVLRLLLLGHPSPAFSDADIRLLADELDCPVVLVQEP